MLRLSLQFIESKNLAMDFLKFISFLASRCISNVASFLKLSWNTYILIREILVLPSMFDEYTPIKDGETVRCICCGGALFLSKDLHEITGSCGRFKRGIPSCSHWKEKGGKCSVNECGRLTPEKVIARDRWMVFKAWTVIEKILHGGWCIISDVSMDSDDIISIIHSLFPINVRLIGGMLPKLLVSIPAAPIPMSVLEIVARKNGRLVRVKINAIDPSHRVFNLFITRSKMTLNSKTFIRNAYPSWKNVQIVT